MFSMFSSQKSVTTTLAACAVTQLVLGVFTLAVSIAASVHTESEQYGISGYILPAKYAISLLSITSFSFGLYLWRLKPRQRFLVDVFQAVNAVTGGIVLLNIAFNLGEAAAQMGGRPIPDEFVSKYRRMWIWWGFMFVSAVLLEIATCLSVLSSRAYITLNFMDSHSASEFVKEEVNILKFTSIAQLAAGLTLPAITLFGILDAHYGWLDFQIKKTEILWYNAVLEFLITILTISSGAQAWSLVKHSTRTKHQFDVLSTINMVICVIVALQLALACVTAWTVAIAHTYVVNMRELWHYYTIAGLTGLMVAVIILVLSVKTVKVSMRAAGSTMPVEMEKEKIRFTSGPNSLL